MLIGYGFDSTTKLEKSRTVFDGSLKSSEYNNSSFKFSSFAFTNNEEYKKKISASMELGANSYFPFTLKCVGEFANELTNLDDSTVYIVNARGIKKTEHAFFDQELASHDIAMQNATTLLSTDIHEFWSKYGDSYISSVHYGKEICLIIKVSKKSSTRFLNLGGKLQVSALDAGNIDSAVKYFNDIESKNTECTIFFQTKGIESTSLPKNRTISDWFAWLKEFEANFTSAPNEEYKSIVGFDIQSYAEVFANTKIINDQVERRLKYYFADVRCTEALDFYTKYYERCVEDSNKATEFYNMKNKLDEIRSNLNTDRSSAQAVIDFKQLIKNINSITIEPMLINTTDSESFEGTIPGKQVCTDQRISPSFKIPSELPSDIYAFSFEVTAPLQGKLSLEYSFDPQVLFDKTTKCFTKKINSSTNKNELVKIETSLREKMKNSFFAFHYHRESRGVRAWLKDNMRCVPCKQLEKFEIKTYLTCEKPSRILDIPDHARSNMLNSSPLVLLSAKAISASRQSEQRLDSDNSRAASVDSRPKSRVRSNSARSV